MSPSERGVLWGLIVSIEELNRFVESTRSEADIGGQIFDDGAVVADAFGKVPCANACADGPIGA